MQHKKARLHTALAALALTVPLCTGFSAAQDSADNQNKTNDTSSLSEASSTSNSLQKLASANVLSKGDDDSDDEDSDDDGNDFDADGDNSGNGQHQASAPQAPLRGITITSIKDIDQTLSVIRSSEKKLTVRVVIRPNVSMDEYKQAIETLRPHAYIMVEILDANNWAPASAESLSNLTEEAIQAFGNKVDIWEVGNELNGSWLGSSPQEINQKVEATYDVVKRHGGRTAITLNYWSHRGCYEKSWENLDSYVGTMPEKLHQVDYMFLSVYEFSCNPAQQPSSSDLAETLKSLGKTFPSAKLGIGEIAANGPDDEKAESDLATKKRIAKRYYGMHNELTEAVGSRYVGGYFWWYFYEDAVTRDTHMWPTLKNLLNKI